MRTSLILATVLPSALGHFVLNYPNSLGFDDDNEGNGPCGGFDVTFGSNDTNVTVGSFAIASLTTHPQADWLFRATLSTAAPFNWTNILPVVSESGLGDFCLTGLTVPSDFAGQRGVIQVIQDAVDGSLYQCAAVNFVEGTTSTVPSVCTNATSVTATITTNTTLAGANSSSSSNTTASSTSAAPSSTSSTGAATQQVVGGLLALAPMALLLL